MARFSLSLARPSRLFRRNTTKDGENDNNAATSTTSTSSQYTDESNSRHNSAANLAPQQPQQATRKRSASLTKLREKFLDRGGSVPEVPASVQEVRESQFYDNHDLEVGSEQVSRRSGSETLVLGRSPAEESVSVVGEEQAPSVTEWKLDECGQEQQHTNHVWPPAVVLEEATPGIAEKEEEGREASPVSRLVAGDYTATPISSAAVSPLTHPADHSSSGNAKVVHTLVDAPPHRHHHLHRHDDSIPSLNYTSAPPTATLLDYFTPGLPNMSQMMHRKIWVRRPGASATLVQIKEDDLVDDVREMILRKYKNSLGGTFDAPDMNLRIVTRAAAGQQQHERMLGPEEEMWRIVEQCYPGGQTVEEALVIDVPTRERRTPRPSPGGRQYQQHPASAYQALEEYRPTENGTDYFPPMPVLVPGAQLLASANSHDGRLSNAHPATAGPALEQPHHQRSISVLNTGQLPPLPSPGGTIRSLRAHREHGRPKFGRQHTSSPTIVSHAPSQLHGGAAERAGGASVPVVATNGLLAAQPPLPNLNLNPQHPMLVHRASTRPRESSDVGQTNGVPAQQMPPTPPVPRDESGGPGGALAAVQGGTTPPTPASSTAGGVAGSLRAGGRPRKGRKSTPDKPGDKGASNSRSRQQLPGTDENGAPMKPSASGGAPGAPSLTSSVLDGSVPPINVLIVEDNIINLRILEGLMKRLRVRWQTAMNGQIAVDKWRKGGFHLVLMDIQMPVMNGLAATKEIRRLERVNGIGVFSNLQEMEGVDADEGGVGVKKMGDVEVPDINHEQDGQGTTHEPSNDRLSLHEGLFKSPVIIVALTASSLQSDRHEALAAGCNDFLTKPVNFVWLERKVKEWGCMQALIDFEGWRAWKVLVAREEEGKTDEQREAERLKAEKEKRRMEKVAVLQEKQRVKKEEEEREKEREKERRRKRASVQSSAEVGVNGNGNSGGKEVDGIAE